MRVLIVEDDAPLRGVIARALRESGYEAETAEDGAQGDALAAAGGFDAIVLDWMLPQLAGLEICRRLRESGDTTPVLLVTARDELDDRVLGLDAGADDYIVKPFHVRELLARLRSVIRRAGSQRSSRYTAGDLVVDVRARTASAAGEPLELTAREYELLEFLVRNAGIALPRERIEEHVWGSLFESASNVVDVFIGRLRRKLGEQGESIETLRGFGYRFTPRSAAR
ncbi:response regulator transcription factor [bacterium]|nr:MAG: response regulator transcription factor [bacterium]